MDCGISVPSNRSHTVVTARVAISTDPLRSIAVPASAVPASASASGGKDGNASTETIKDVTEKFKCGQLSDESGSRCSMYNTAGENTASPRANTVLDRYAWTARHSVLCISGSKLLRFVLSGSQLASDVVEPGLPSKASTRRKSKATAPIQHQPKVGSARVMNHEGHCDVKPQPSPSPPCWNTVASVEALRAKVKR